MTGLADNTPVLVGVGQCVDHWDGEDVAQAPSPQSLMLKASRAALVDCGAPDIVSAIDAIAVTRLFADSMAGVRGAEVFGSCNNLPRYIGREIGVEPKQAIYSIVGGQTPQTLVNEFAEEIFAGRTQAALLTGSEAIAAAKLALRSGKQLDWSDDVEGDMEDRGFGKMLLDGYEMANGIGAPTATYPLFENALRARLGKSVDEHVDDMAELWHRFSKVAAANSIAQFPQERSADFLKTPSAENYPIAEPYLKWHVAQDAVNQGAALILTSVGKAKELGISQDKWIFLHGYAAADEKLVSKREDISRSVAAEKALALAMQSARKTAADIRHIDLYSCFPVAVFLAAEALGLDWRTQDLTLTGGLPFFGGAGNNYSMHAIAVLVQRLRDNPGEFGLIVANGGYLSKQAVGIYSTKPKPDWQPISSAAIQSEIDAMPDLEPVSEDCEAIIKSYTVSYRKGIASRATVVAETNSGDRIIAKTGSDIAVIADILKTDPLGRKVTIVKQDKSNIITG